MGDVGHAQAAKRSRSVANRSLNALRRERQRFWIGVACAALVHAALIVGAGRTMLRDMGEREGQRDGISVLLVDEADLKSRTTVPVDPVTPPGPTETAALAQPPPPPPSPEPEPQAAPKQAKAADQEAPEASPVPGLTPKQTGREAKESKEARETKDAKERAKTSPARDQPLQLSLPEVPYIPPGGRMAAVSRPPGITRSGENDDFWRGVIAALRRTMPIAYEPRRVTIRLLLSEMGNIVDVQLLRSGGDPIMDQNVMFAAKQASFPIPPRGATEVDRIFVVTYIYQ